MSCDFWSRELEVLVDGCEVGIKSVCGSCRARQGVYSGIYTPSELTNKEHESSRSLISPHPTKATRPN